MANKFWGNPASVYFTRTSAIEMYAEELIGKKIHGDTMLDLQQGISAYIKRLTKAQRIELKLRCKAELSVEKHDSSLQRVSTIGTVMTAIIAISALILPSTIILPEYKTSIMMWLIGAMVTLFILLLVITYGNARGAYDSDRISKRCMAADFILQTFEQFEENSAPEKSNETRCEVVVMPRHKRMCCHSKQATHRNPKHKCNHF